MEITEYRNVFENEATHFFYVSTHNLVIRLIGKWMEKKELVILDAGCGTGGMMKRLSNFGSVEGVDYSDEAIKYARKRGLTVRKASLIKLPFKGGSFDLVTCIDVIYHREIRNDVAALREILRVLKPGGVLILRVPANKFLLSTHDRHVHTARRYDKDELEKKVRKSGFLIEHISYVHSPIFPVNLLKIVTEKIARKPEASAVGRVNPLINKLLTVVLDIEGWLIAQGLAMPFGQGLILVARRT